MSDMVTECCNVVDHCYLGSLYHTWAIRHMYLGFYDRKEIVITTINKYVRPFQRGTPISPEVGHQLPPGFLHSQDNRVIKSMT